MPSGGIGVSGFSFLQNYDIPPYYGSVITKLIAKGKNKGRNIQRNEKRL